jgi:hypothetical protein
VHKQVHLARVRSLSGTLGDTMKGIQFVARIDDLSSPEVQALVAEHLQGMHSNSPSGPCGVTERHVVAAHSISRMGSLGARFSVSI